MGPVRLNGLRNLWCDWCKINCMISDIYQFMVYSSFFSNNILDYQIIIGLSEKNDDDLPLIPIIAVAAGVAVILIILIVTLLYIRVRGLSLDGRGCLA